MAFLKNEAISILENLTRLSGSTQCPDLRFFPLPTLHHLGLTSIVFEKPARTVEGTQKAEIS
jgi:hypothetical protein